MITLESVNQGPLIIPARMYADWVQGAVYQAMGEPVARVVHDHGFVIEGRSLRLFTFSQLFGTYQLKSGVFAFNWPIQLVVSSPIRVIIDQFIQALLSRHQWRIGPTPCRLGSITVQEPRVTDNKILVRTLSPITIHSTFEKPDGGVYTQYYHPREVEFGRLIRTNLLRKYQVIYGHPWGGAESDFSIRAQGATKFHLVRYKKTIIKGYAGMFRLEGSKDLLQVGLDAGLGDRNSQGFGLVESISGNEVR
ncbi:CRISPR-associated protein Cas6 [Sulfobacillus acidophilus TPY]|nr:CRISPR-associated protein Cas6 [Sulfobacillus acidophilus TPY]